jgi:hypothetical protein
LPHEGEAWLATRDSSLTYSDPITGIVRDGWGEDDYRLGRTIPIKAAIARAVGVSLAYVDPKCHRIFKDLGDEIWQRLYPPVVPTTEPIEGI